MFFDAECALVRTRDINKLAAKEAPAITKKLSDLLQPNKIKVFGQDGRLRVALRVATELLGVDWASIVRKRLGTFGYRFEKVGPDGKVESEGLKPLPLQAVSPAALPLTETIKMPIEYVAVVVTDEATITTDLMFVVAPKSPSRPRRQPAVRAK